MLRTKIMGALLSILIGVSSISTSALPTASAAKQQQMSVTASPTTSQVIIDKQEIVIQGYNINGSNYFKLRDLAQSLNGTSKQFSVGWNGKSNTIELTAGSPYVDEKASSDTTSTTNKGKQKAIVSKASIIINNQPVVLSAYLINGNTYFKLRDLGDRLQFPVVYRPVDKTIHIMTASEVSVQQFSNLKLNLGSADYRYSNWRSRNNRAMYEANNQLYIVEHVSKLGEIHITQLSNGNKVIVRSELDSFGGFHAGEDGNNYMIYGQDNMEESATKPVYRIVKYDSAWRKIASLDISDVHVTRPFDAGNVSMDSANGQLAVHMTRQRYLNPNDGLHHQSNMTLIIDMSNMSLIHKSDAFPKNHVSHSFATYVRLDGDHIVYADHGDAYPRSHILQVEPISNYAINKDDDDDYFFTEIHEYPFADALGGITGDNYTGLYLGGFEIGKSNYVVASTFSKQYLTNPNSQNVRIDYVNRDYSYDFSGHTLWLTNYESKDNVTINQVHIVKIDDQTFVVLWDEDHGTKVPNRLVYAVVNDGGIILQQPKELLGITAPGGMDPLVNGRSITWYNYDYRLPRYNSESELVNPVELYTLTIAEFGSKVNGQVFTYLEPKPDRFHDISNALMQLGYTVGSTYFDENTSSRSYSVVDIEGNSKGYFEIIGDVARLSTGYAAESGHTFINSIDHLAEELDMVKTVIETDLQLQLPNFSSDVISKIDGHYQNLKPVDDFVEFELNYSEFRVRGRFHIAGSMMTGEPLHSLRIQYYSDVIKQKYGKEPSERVVQ